MIKRLITVDDMAFYPYPNNIQERLDNLKEKNAKVTEKFISSQRSTFFSFLFNALFPPISSLCEILVRM